MRTTLPFNADWLYAASELTLSAPDSAFEEPVTLPHSNVILPYHNFDNAEYQFISTYRKRFTLPEALNGRRVFLDFDGAMILTTVFVNGHDAGTNAGGYNLFSFDITDYLVEGENVVQVRLDSTERPDIPPYGYVVDYLTFGGIYRDVSLRMVEPIYVANVFARTFDVLTGKPQAEIDVTVRNTSGENTRVILRSLLNLVTDARNTMELNLGYQEITGAIPAHSETTLTIPYRKLPPMPLWSVESPTLYPLKVVMEREENRRKLDEYDIRFGFREAHFSEDGHFYLNGQPLKLRGLNRHQTYPYIGAAAPVRLQRKDAEIIKHELGCNIVRTSHYPQSPHFLNRCDEIGLLVFEEIPGWQYIGDEDWKAISLRDVEAMIGRDRNHPSIILWGVRINESFDDHDFYVATNALAHQLDPTRQTGGVRNFRDSEFLEDVYTYNDFSNTIIEPDVTPHLVTEFSGHMFSTKTFDNEDRAMEHALRHARIQNAAAGNPRVAGAIGWCAFDYNTHAEFGSGDRICYHGVSDIFRLPKWAGYVYESQIDPAIRPVVRAATYWSLGDRSTGGNDPLIVFSNCEEIEIAIGTERYGRFQPDRATYPHLPHPPFTVPKIGNHNAWGRANWDLHVVGFIGGRAVAEAHYAGDGLPRQLLLMPDDTELAADGADMTRLVVKIVDGYGNRRPYALQPIQFEIEGPGELIGENPFALVGGQAALYLKAGKTPGTVTVRATTARLEPATAVIEIR